jgi:NAD(P)-dependent dehydrogenase (short-subunit alcohol dehydrogenase family)
MASAAEHSRVNSGANGTSGGRKSVLVTGGASGIGLAMVRHLASEGYRVSILDVNENVGQEIASQVASDFPNATVVFKRADVSSWEQQAAAFKEVFEESGGHLDVVMANAGISEQGATTVVDLQENEPSKPRLKSVDVNLTGTIYCESHHPRFSGIRD